MASSILLKYFGRKFLLIVMPFAMTAVHVLLGLSMIMNWPSAVTVTLVILFVILFEFAQGPITWLYMAEVMEDKAVSLGTAINWLMVIILSLSTSTLV